MVTLTISELLELGLQKMLRHGIPENEAQAANPIYLEAELWGKVTHGYRHLNNNLLQYKTGQDRLRAIEILRDTPVSALVDAGFHFPYYCHRMGMELAIQKAQQSGMGMVGVRNAAASGLLGYYSQMATEAGLVGVAINTASPVVVAPGSIAPLLSTNPLTVGIPRLGQTPLILDMATSAGTFNQVLVAQRDKKPLPEGIAVDLDGYPTTDPFAIVDKDNRPRLLPFAGYKGFGLNFMIELMTTGMMGMIIGQPKASQTLWDPTNFGGVYFAYRPDLFVDRATFDAGVDQLVNDIKSGQKAPGVEEVRLPGEESQRRKAETLARGTVDLAEPTHEFLLS